ncbi:prolyl-tRNA synthetase associated domain-containing protein [Pedomonas mirosovicensis]|uniref:prolyl-tRNA synthetase associated domain-containing protein n=1 Tax=Pedomonas mirosovicensis TaxID=2908641 RepID=UPI00216A06AA|nr:prolyl-tRNA synthetase associated domain-containing protein [Pedomonas mirosovicensis]MCH8684134.1 prolyl-tRNA synthetase associated domain-containing protein [Pedomonas mirosovicensis]
MTFLVIDDEKAELEARVFGRLDRLGIPHRTVRHPPAHTVEEARRLRGDLAGGHAKNLFLKSKRDEYVLAVAQEDAPVDVQALARACGVGRLSFARPERVFEWLGVWPGAVTPFALVNAQQHPNRNRLRIVVDQTLLDHETVWFHPLHNAATTGISSAGLVRFIEDCGWAPVAHRFA